MPKAQGLPNFNVKPRIGAKIKVYLKKGNDPLYGKVVGHSHRDIGNPPYQREVVLLTTIDPIPLYDCEYCLEDYKVVWVD